jgi:hypothetical protein
MQNRTNIQSTLIGAAFGALIVLSIAAATTHSPSFGRFQLAVGDNLSGSVWKVDTAIGQVWRIPVSNPSPQFMSANVAQ